MATPFGRAGEFNSVNVSYPMPVYLSAGEQSQACLIDSYNCSTMSQQSAKQTEEFTLSGFFSPREAMNSSGICTW